MWTKEQRAAYMKKYRAEHREQIRATRRYYYHHVQKLQPCTELTLQQKARQKEYHRAWRENNRERWNSYQREYRKRRIAEGSGS